MITLTEKWTKELSSKPETGMGYQIVSIILSNGRRYDQVVVVEGNVTSVRGLTEIPFTEVEISKIIVTHEKWNFTNEPTGQP